MLSPVHCYKQIKIPGKYINNPLKLLPIPEKKTIFIARLLTRKASELFECRAVIYYGTLHTIHSIGHS